ncbi:PIG-L deacetylase family protein [Gallibacter sp. Marseille-QA0791]|uniref:PIG-L deacetylase family protein n=1 Tax=Gallibacter sp. Marseille-QA0791 TaxID=3378781 RepID=UPI003D0C5E4C
MSILVISPHMDDETLGAGGTILKYTDAGEKVYWLNISNTKEEYGYSEELCRKREKRYYEVIRRLHITDAVDFKLQPAHLEKYDTGEIINKIGNIVDRIKPEIIITTSPGDVHSDHKTVFSWAKAFSKSFRNPWLKKFLLMEIVSETDFALPMGSFIPNYFVDISDFLEDKIEALKIYEGEMGEHPFPRSVKNIKALAVNRGTIAGTKYAEAFMLLRCIEK